MTSEEIVAHYKLLREARDYAQTLIGVNVKYSSRDYSEEEECLNRFVDATENYFSAQLIEAGYEYKLALYCKVLEARADLLTSQKNQLAKDYHALKRRGYA